MSNAMHKFLTLQIKILFFSSHTGILGNAATAIFVPHRAESGPSGSHFGLLAALIVEVVNAWPLLKHPIRAVGKLILITLALFILGNFFLSLFIRNPT